MLYPLEYDFNDLNEEKGKNLYGDNEEEEEEEINVKDIGKEFGKIKIRRKAAINAEKKMKLQQN